MKTKIEIINDLSERNSGIIKKDKGSYRDKLAEGLVADDYRATVSGIVAKVILKHVDADSEENLVEATIKIYTLLCMVQETEEIFAEQLKSKT